jgi:hypothetical protein
MGWPCCAVYAALTIISHVLLAGAGPGCPLIGPEFPPPQHLSTHPIFQQAIQNLTAVFSFIETSNTTGSSNYSYSVQVFSTNPGLPLLFERYHTAPNLPSLNSTGVKEVGPDTVYRLGSLTKVFTVLAFLSEAGDVHFNEPITKFVPELAELNAKTMGVEDPLRNVDWDDVTIGSLAAQMSGIARDCKFSWELSWLSEDDLASLHVFTIR